MIDAIILINIIILMLDAFHFLRDPSSIWRLFKFCYSMIIGGGFVFILWMDYVWGYKFKIYDVELVNAYFLYGYVCIWIGFLSFEFIFRALSEISHKKNHYSNNYSVLGNEIALKYGLRFLCTLSVLSVLAYVKSTGVSFGSSSYQSRYEDAAGSGIFLLLIPGFMPYAAFRLLKTNAIKSFIIISVVTILYALFIFVLLKGYRQIFIATILLLLIISFKKGFLSRKIIAISFMFIPFILLGMSFLRYLGEDGTPFSDVMTASLYYIQGDLFPADAPLRTYWYCQNNPCPRLDVFTNHLMKFVPRAFYPEKPLITMDAAGFYTKIIVGYERDLTLSSTILSEAIMMKSWVLFSSIMLLSGFVAGSLNRIAKSNRHGFIYYIVISNSYIGFFWVREGLEDALNRIIIMIIYALISVVVGWSALVLINPRALKVRLEN